MTSVSVRQQLHGQIERLPDEMIQQIADFTFFMMTRRGMAPLYEEWSADQWQTFSLGQFFRDEDEIGYSLEDAKEIYHP